MKMIRKGEYDLVNISLLGLDPVTGRSYDECHAEWKAELDRVTERMAKMRWWHIAEQVRVRWQIVCLSAKFGSPC